EYCLAILIIATFVATSLVGSSHGIRGGNAIGNSSSLFNVLNFGAIGDGKIDDTQAFTKAWVETCNESGNVPTLVVPIGHTFLLNPISFEGPCKSPSIHVEIHGNIVAPNTIGSWEKCEKNVWIYFANVDNLVVEGEGQINGKGAIWWKKNVPNNLDMYAMSNALSFFNCNGLTVRGLTHRNGPGGHISLVGCNNSTVSNVNIFAPGDSPNTDGIDISSTANLNIFDSIIGTGTHYISLLITEYIFLSFRDDCIAISSGTSFINITNVTCGPGHGISVGSLGIDGSEAKVEEIHVRNCTFMNTTNGARIKTWQGGAGYARKITYDDINLMGAQNPIIIDQYYCIKKMCKLQPSAVAVSDIQFTNIRGTSASVAAINLNCSQAIPCSHIVVENIEITPLNPRTNVTNFCGHANVQQKS
ncbi:hypothetical protein RDABS01_012880, partial [Bienertia sinuspersici]